MTSSTAPVNGRTGQPWLRRGAGVLLVVLAAVHLAVVLDWHARAGYLDAGLLAVGGAAAVGAVVVVGRGHRADWQFAGGLAAAAAAGYLVSRGVGWPGAGREVGRWTSPQGSAALLVDLATLGLAAIALHRPARPLPTRSQPGRTTKVQAR